MLSVNTSTESTGMNATYLVSFASCSHRCIRLSLFSHTLLDFLQDDDRSRKYDYPTQASVSSGTWTCGGVQHKLDSKRWVQQQPTEHSATNNTKQAKNGGRCTKTVRANGRLGDWVVSVSGRSRGRRAAHLSAPHDEGKCRQPQ